jgi:hypothetical protein
LQLRGDVTSFFTSVNSVFPLRTMAIGARLSY